MSGKESKQRQLKLSEAAKGLGRSMLVERAIADGKWQLELQPPSPVQDWLILCLEVLEEEVSEGYM